MAWPAGSGGSGLILITRRRCPGIDADALSSHADVERKGYGLRSGQRIICSAGLTRAPCDLAVAL